MIIKCGYMKRCVGQCRYLKANMDVGGGWMNRTGVRNMDCLFLIFELGARYTEYLETSLKIRISSYQRQISMIGRS